MRPLPCPVIQRKSLGVLGGPRLKQFLRTLIVIPSFNEEGKIGKVVRRIMTRIGDCVVVDDGSPDDIYLYNHYKVQEFRY
jgi:acetylornithine deacetylase/succinyl-diaminopimelate desuccinylase-like protein